MRYLLAIKGGESLSEADLKRFLEEHRRLSCHISETDVPGLNDEPFALEATDEENVIRVLRLGASEFLGETPLHTLAALRGGYDGRR